uniref:phosphatidylglycerophosphatase n=1 Tax=Salix viminalis TaxID=40686 RepID=A0A6N2NDF7_SALVM
MVKCIIEEIRGGDQDDDPSRSVVVLDAKRVLVGAGARALFYPTLLYNVLRNKIQSEFRWWDRVDQFILLGAVPFPTDVPRLKRLGVSGVVTLNESYETLVPTSLYHAYDIDHLVIPTRDYMFAPSITDICQAVDFIHENASLGKTTYVHCKAGRGRSTTIVLCYLAVQDYYLLKVKKSTIPGCMIIQKALDLPIKEDGKQDTAAFDDGSAVLVTESDLDGYDATRDSGVVGNDMLGELSLACKVQFASQAAIARLSYLWPGYQPDQKSSTKKLGSSIRASQLSSINVDIRVC